jgi:NodT family efflux transporter outer membrane factor (OMF) lipoprotein
MRKALAAAGLAAGVLAGCTTVGPNYIEPQAAPPAAWQRLDTTTNTSTAARSGDLASWWTALGDPALSDLVGRALAANTDLRSAQAKLREARARRDLARANLAPTITGSAGASRSRGSEEAGSGRTTELYQAGLDASWEADLFGARRRGIEAAQADLEAIAADLQSTQVSLVAEVALNYIDARAYQTRLEVARRNLDAQAEISQLTDWRAQAGLVSALEAEQVRATLEQTRAQVPALESLLAQTQDRIAVLLGTSTGALPGALMQPAAIPAAPASVAVGIPADVLRQRPDLQAAERHLAAETARIGQTAAQRYPDLTLSGSIGLEALTLGGLGSTTALAHTIAAAVSGVLFDGGRIARQVEAQEAVRDQAAAAYEKAVLTALQDVETALAAVQQTRARQRILGDAVAAARNAALYATQRYRSGIVDFQAVLDTQRTVLSVEDALAASQADAAAAVVRLYKALGGGWTPAPQTESQQSNAS